MTSIRAISGALAVCVLSGACGPDLTQPFELKEPRIFAARVEVVDEPARSRPRFGESFRIRQYVALPKLALATPLAGRYSLSLALCAGVKLPNGALGCAPIGADGATDLPLTPEITQAGDYELILDGLEVPAFVEQLLTQLPPPFDAIDRLPVFGALCIDGQAERVPGKSINEDATSTLFRCAGNADAEFPEPLVFTLSVLLDRGKLGDLNTSPSFACDEAAGQASACNAGVGVPGEQPRAGSFVLVLPPGPGAAEGTPRQTLAWEPTPEPTPWDDCADPERFAGPKIAAGAEEKLRIRVRFDPSDRETYSFEETLASKPEIVTTTEEMLVSHAATDGKLDRYFSVLTAEVEAAQAEIEVEYEVPGDPATDPIPEGGKLVQFYFGLRDGRGGQDFAIRSFCLLPATR